MSEILVFSEVKQNKLDSSTGELLSAGQKLSKELNIPLSIIIFNATDSLKDEARQWGADNIYTANDQLLESSIDEVYLEALQQVCAFVNPSVILAAKTSLGRNVAARIAYRLNSSVAQDCIDISGDEKTGKIIFTRLVYGGNARANCTFNETATKVAILRVKSFECPEQNISKVSEVHQINIKIDKSKLKLNLVDTVKQESKSIKLEEASVIVGGGRGLGGPEPFKHLEELAKILNGAVGASRAVCDAGWLDHSYQIGLTGKTVTPELYITIGISGASQHMAGCSSSKNIVAINKDEDANIFKAANFGVIGDWETILPSFTKTIRELIDS